MRRPEGQVDAREFVEASPRVMRAVECGHTLGSASIVFSANAAGKENGRRRRQRGRAAFGSHEWDSGLRLRLPSGAKFVTAPADPPSLGIRPQRHPMHTPIYRSSRVRAEHRAAARPYATALARLRPTSHSPPVRPWQRSAAQPCFGARVSCEQRLRSSSSLRAESSVSSDDQCRCVALRATGSAADRSTGVLYDVMRELASRGRAAESELHSAITADCGRYCSHGGRHYGSDVCVCVRACEGSLLRSS